MNSTVYLNHSLDNTSFTLVISNDELPLTKSRIAATLVEIAQQLNKGEVDEGRSQLELPGILSKEVSKKFNGIGDIEPNHPRTDIASSEARTVCGFTEWYDKGNGAV